MSIGPSSAVLAGVAGSPLAQTAGTDAERARHDTTAREAHVQNARKADSASGIGETDGQEHGTNERDADGRLPWQLRPPTAKKPDEPPPAVAPAKDPRGESGNSLDLVC